MNRDEIKYIIRHLVMKKGPERTKQLEELKKLSQDDLYHLLKEFVENIDVNDEKIAHNSAELIAVLMPDIGLDLLIDNLQNNYIPLRWDIVILLGDIGDKQAIPNLIKVLLKDPDPDIRIQATVSLSKLGGHEALQALKEVVDKDFEEDYEGRTVSECAKNAIKKILRHGNTSN
jgi:HEAT repeat protein